MKSKSTILAAFLLIAPALHAQPEERSVSIRLVRLASEGRAEVVAPTMVVADTKEIRVRIDSEQFDVAVMPRLDGDRVALAIRTFAKDQDGKEVSSSLPVITTKLGLSVEVRIGDVGYRVVATR